MWFCGIQILAKEHEATKPLLAGSEGVVLAEVGRDEAHAMTSLGDRLSTALVPETNATAGHELVHDGLEGLLEHIHGYL